MKKTIIALCIIITAVTAILGTADWSAGTYTAQNGGIGYYFGTCYADSCYTTVEFSGTFEDGSGRIAYCLAGHDCQ